MKEIGLATGRRTPAPCELKIEDIFGQNLQRPLNHLDLLPLKQK